MKIMFSVIVVCYNAGPKLIQTINNIMEQTYPFLEIIIKDGMSTDNSLANLPENANIKLVCSKDEGIYDAMNQAVSKASGEYFFFLNCGDTFYEKNILEQIAKFIEKNPNKGIYYGDTFNETTHSQVPLPKKITAFTCYRHIPCHQACFYDRKLFEGRKYDTTYHIRADYDHFLWCFFKGNAVCAHVGFTVANYEGGGFSESLENKKRDKAEHKEIVQKYMTGRRLFSYRMYMAVTLAPLRRMIGNSKHLSKLYQGMKKFLYR